jgi:hypothetical protein
MIHRHHAAVSPAKSTRSASGSTVHVASLCGVCAALDPKQNAEHLLLHLDFVMDGIVRLWMMECSAPTTDPHLVGLCSVRLKRIHSPQIGRTLLRKKGGAVFATRVDWCVVGAEC